MKVELTIKKEYEVEYLLAEVGARYWEDADVNDVEDSDGLLIPCRDGEYWKPLISLETGQIINWEIGKKAKIHYKSCDNNLFKLLDKDQNIIASIEGYVIDMMCPEGNGYGDYVKMAINENGFIEDFEANFSDFENNNE